MNSAINLCCTAIKSKHTVVTNLLRISSTILPTIGRNVIFAKGSLVLITIDVRINFRIVAFSDTTDDVFRNFTLILGSATEQMQKIQFYKAIGRTRREVAIAIKVRLGYNSHKFTNRDFTIGKFRFCGNQTFALHHMRIAQNLLVNCTNNGINCHNNYLQCCIEGYLYGIFINVMGGALRRP